MVEGEPLCILVLSKLSNKHSGKCSFISLSSMSGIQKLPLPYLLIVQITSFLEVISSHVHWKGEGVGA